MSIFWDWVKKHHPYIEGVDDDTDPADKFRFSTDDELDYAQDHEKIRSELFKTVLAKYPEESMKFFQRLAHKDQEIAEMVKKMGRPDSRSFKHVGNSSDDEVVPPSADVGYSSGNGGE